jgi:phage protein D
VLGAHVAALRAHVTVAGADVVAALSSALLVLLTLLPRLLKARVEATVPRAGAAVRVEAGWQGESVAAVTMLRPNLALRIHAAPAPDDGAAV